jgi:hypothetical protein
MLALDVRCFMLEKLQSSYRMKSNWQTTLTRLKVIFRPCHGSGILMAGLSLWRLRLTPRSLHMGFVVDKVALGQVFL